MRPSPAFLYTLAWCLIFWSAFGRSAQAAIDPEQSSFPPVVLVCPRGDAETVVRLIDTGGNPISDAVVRIRFLDACVARLCPGDSFGPLVESVTGPDGVAVFLIEAGGCCQFMGVQYEDAEGTVLGTAGVRSPDMPITPTALCNEFVDLADVGEFVELFLAGSAACDDMDGSGRSDLADLGIFAWHLGHTAP